MFANYIKEIKDFDCLSKLEEKELFNSLKNGDENARNIIANSNLKLVVKIAHEYKGMGVSLEDLICVGNVGLVEAIDKFDGSKGAKFSTYASYWIKHNIRREIDKNGRSITFSPSVLNKMKKLKKLKDEKGEDFNMEDALEAVKSKRRGYVASLIDGYSQCSLHQNIGDGDDVLMDVIADNNNWMNNFESNDDFSFLMEKIGEVLNDTEIEIIKFRFGINGVDALTQKELALKMGFTHQRIQQIEKDALKKLKRFFKNKGRIA